MIAIVLFGILTVTDGNAQQNTPDEDGGSKIVLSVNSPRVREDAGKITVTVTATTRNGLPSLSNLLLNIFVIGDTAFPETDFVAVDRFRIPLPIGSVSAMGTFDLTLVNDKTGESDETLWVLATFGIERRTKTRMTITDDDNIAEPLGQEDIKVLNKAVLPGLVRMFASGTTKAIADRIKSVASGKNDKAALVLPRQSSPYDNSVKSNWQGLEQQQDSLDIKELLDGTSFVLPLTGNSAKFGADDGETPATPDASQHSGLTLWGSGNYLNFSSKNTDNVEWDDDVFGAHIGMDGWITHDILVGLAVSRSEGALDYNTKVLKGKYKTLITSVHPYVNWSPDDDLSLWGTMGYGWGEIKIDDEALGQLHSDMEMQTLAIGSNNKLFSTNDFIVGNKSELRLKSEAMIGQMKILGHDRVAPLAVDYRRLRLMLEGSTEQALSSDTSLTPSLELGVRHDGGDGVTGFGMELGGGLNYTDRSLGLTVVGSGRMLSGLRGMGDRSLNQP